jgi:hypothetical protein
MWVTTHSKKEVSDNTQEKNEHYSSRKVNTTAQEIDYKKITNDQVGRIERN